MKDSSNKKERHVVLWYKTISDTTDMKLVSEPIN